MGRRQATEDEARALANPLRLRILRLCLDAPLTNKQIADALGRDPGSTLHHVRMLVETGFLTPDEVRQGSTGALEKPYRATGKSWEVSVEERGATAADANAAMVEAFREEMTAAGPEQLLFLSRFANRLNEASYREFTARVEALINEFARRNDRDGVAMAFLFGGHLREALLTERDD